MQCINNYRLILKYLLGTFVTCLVLILGLAFIENQAHPVEKLLDEIVYDNRNHYLPCDQLPTLGEVEGVLAKHKDMVKKIEQMDTPGYVQVLAADADSCPGKADILIMYPSRSDRIKIQQILNTDTFFGMPYRLLDM